MKLTPELHALTLVATATVLMWLPYMVARIMTRGLSATLDNPAASHLPDPEWAQRAKLAHANAIENLAVFAPLVLVGAATGVSTLATIVAAKLYLWARLVHYAVYAAGIPVLRTVAFVAGFAATLVFAVTLLTHAA
ncbi:MAPEG family protein [Paraburkholderia humisilvae]|uniref:MAPEG family protein n=1 Tax=Paraburkholderia humisilvae TaxID=627669 RepID=A0A6J5DT66_9BURK|nr:MAPEG family protein [Paraburkholderia humisilvae]CAB3757113.1 hypothetical protein LMG29542_03009 [Paraburkholderia humisilvae]